MEKKWEQPKPCCAEDKESGEQCKEDGMERYSLGLYAGRYCDKHWEESGYRKEGRKGFDPADAGEAYDENDY